jgi:hypothetical protein
MNKPSSWTSYTIAGWIGIILLFGPLVTVEAAPVVIQGGSVFNSISGVMQQNRTVVIDGQRITYVGAPGGYTAPSNAKIINAQGKFIIPGLIDGHAHMAFPLNDAGVSPEPLLPQYVAYGVTTLRNAGDNIAPELAIANYAASHLGNCPRIYTCSTPIDGSPTIHGSSFGMAVTSPSSVPAIMTDMAAQGVTTVKIYGGTQRAVGSAVITEAHKHGLFVTGHLINYSAQDAVADGIDGLEHITTVSDFGGFSGPTLTSLISSIVAKGVTVAPTLTVFRNMLLLADQPEIYGNPDNDAASPALRDYWERIVAAEGLNPDNLAGRLATFANYEALTGILYRAGVRILAGTDTPEPYCPPGSTLHQELELLVESGLTPAAALQAATINNAWALKQDQNLGSIDVGKLADMVILNADPTIDINNSRSINHVILNGQVMPEPCTLILLVTGGLVLFAYAWRKR